MNEPFSSASDRDKLDKAKILKAGICVLLVLAVIIKIIDVSLWRGYNEKYYEGFITLFDIDEKNTLDGVSRWGYVPYEFSDGSRKCILAYTKPSVGKYTVRIQLDNSGILKTGSDESCTAPISADKDSVRCDFEIGVVIRRFNTFDYFACIDPGSGEVFGFDFGDDDTFLYSRGTSLESKQTAEKLRPEIMKIKNELKTEIIDKLIDQQ